ncbi:MAG: alpha/beta hydrolase [Rhodospirillum sp.]|nr:alpha/beta hydrolase [Rhodospirillum sp.]MCF8491674.1 alpha/beta hydrolase [Rhodospirillum sp.]MCF8502932.1 alpha/beta hydrolase [Rhodospirillum sp.]
MTATPLFVPGWRNSGPDHWQSLWEEDLPGAIRVEQRDWENPNLLEWMTGLSTALDHAEPPVVLVAHSLGCILVAHWALRAGSVEVSRVAGALLVAPPDVEGETAPEAVRSFGPIPMEALPFPAMVVGSHTDPYCPLARTHELASAWGARFEDAGESGHITAESGHGPWPFGERLMLGLLMAFR